MVARGSTEGFALAGISLARGTVARDSRERRSYNSWVAMSRGMGDSSAARINRPGSLGTPWRAVETNETKRRADEIALALLAHRLQSTICRTRVELRRFRIIEWK